MRCVNLQGTENNINAYKNIFFIILSFYKLFIAIIVLVYTC